MKRTPPTWTLLATLLGTTTSIAWLGSLPDNGHDAVSSGGELLYIVQPLPNVVDATLGVLGMIAAAIAAVFVIKEMIHRVTSPVWLWVYSLLAFSGFTFGTVWFSITWGTEDANIGGGIALIFFLPWAVLLLIAALITYALLRRRANREVDVSAHP